MEPGATAETTRLKCHHELRRTTLEVAACSGASTRFVESEHGCFAATNLQAWILSWMKKITRGILAALTAADEYTSWRKMVLLVWPPGHPIVNRARAGGAQ